MPRGNKLNETKSNKAENRRKWIKIETLSNLFIYKNSNYEYQRQLWLNQNTQTCRGRMWLTIVTHLLILMIMVRTNTIINAPSCDALLSILGWIVYAWTLKQTLLTHVDHFSNLCLIEYAVHTIILNKTININEYYETLKTYAESSK